MLYLSLWSTSITITFLVNPRPSPRPSPRFSGTRTRNSSYSPGLCLEADSFSAFFLRVDRPTPANPVPGQPKPLQLCPQQSLDETAYYAWFYDGSPLTTILGGAAMVVIMLAGVMFPLWPVKLRVGVWYLSILALGLLGALIVLAIVRLIFWCVTVVVCKKAIWMFPNLFEDVGFVSHHVPRFAVT